MTPLLISSFGVSPQVAVGSDFLYASIAKTAEAGAPHNGLIYQIARHS